MIKLSNYAPCWHYRTRDSSHDSSLIRGARLKCLFRCDSMLNATSRDPRRCCSVALRPSSAPRVLRFMVFDLQACQGCMGLNVVLQIRPVALQVPLNKSCFRGNVSAYALLAKLDKA